MSMTNRSTTTAKLPLGLQSFAKVRKLNCTYVNTKLLPTPSEYILNP